MVKQPSNKQVKQRKVHAVNGYALSERLYNCVVSARQLARRRRMFGECGTGQTRGFSPHSTLHFPCGDKQHVARGSVDRTAYSPKYSLSFMSHHAERISLSVVRGVNRAIRSHLATLSARLARA